MTIKQLKQLIANLPDGAEVLTWDRDTANPVERVMTYNLKNVPAVDGVKVENADDRGIGEDFSAPIAAALVLVCNE